MIAIGVDELRKDPAPILEATLLFVYGARALPSSGTILGSNDRLGQRSGVLILSAGVDSAPAKGKSESHLSARDARLPGSPLHLRCSGWIPAGAEERKGRADYHSFRLSICMARSYIRC